MNNDISNTNTSSDLSNNSTDTITETRQNTVHTYPNYYRPPRYLNRSRGLSNLFSTRSRYQSPISNYLQSSYVYNTTNYEDLINNTLEEEKKFKNVLSREGFKQLQFCVFTDEEFEKKEKYKFINNTCCISQTKFKDNDVVVMLPCNHIFNPSDILFWLTEKQARCPCCRYELKSIEKRIVEESSAPQPPTNNNYIIRSNTSNTLRRTAVVPVNNSRVMEDPAEPSRNGTRSMRSTRVLPFQSHDSESETDTEVQEIIDGRNTDDSDDDIGQPYISTNNEQESTSVPNITNNINEITLPSLTNRLPRSTIPMDINSLLHNLRSLSQTTIEDPSNSTLNSRYNFLEDYIENSYLETNEIQRTLYESLSYNTSRQNNTTELCQEHREQQQEQQQVIQQEQESSESETSDNSLITSDGESIDDESIDDELFSDVDEWSD